ncbi:MAG: DMT family transporter [Peptococcaceae bacterium]|jgi:drug/metabolite transporter (DMT)-like permease|nr:DMT family transporter [Peptococcaceae bacterium]
MNKRILWGHLMTLVTVIIWGTTFVSTKALLSELKPVEIMFFRFVLAYAALWIVYPQAEKPRGWRDELLFFASGLCGVTLYFLTENIALSYTLASNVGLIIAAAPIFTAILAHFLTRDERMGKHLILGFILAFGGVFLIMLNGAHTLQISPLGDGLALAATLCWAGYCILLRKLGDRYHQIYLTRKIFFYGLLTMAPVFLLSYQAGSAAKLFQPWILGNIVFLGLAGSTLGYVLWNIAIQFLGAIKTSHYLYLIPFVTVLTARVALGERITTIAMVGACFILAGVYIAERGLIFAKE